VNYASYLVNKSPLTVVDLLENILYALIWIVGKQSVCSDTNCCDSGEDALTTGSTGVTQRVWTTRSIKATWRREKEDIPK